MGRPEITVMLSSLLEEHINAKDPRTYWAKEVTFDFSSANPVRVDYMRFKPINNSVSGIEKGDYYCYEVKSSVEDFNSKHGHNFLGDYNYYVMPEEVYSKVESKIPYDVGALVLSNGASYLKAVKKARRRDRKRAGMEMLLMMYRSFARDEHRGGERNG